ncbi:MULTISPECIES: hypothetical protein [unclassified Nostoc]|uniref:hypothetical protein n=1 Tax=unclassified Nostoc TaxID=2593658 RepID=UPI000B950CF0|nr:hypothetical protein [Nostoc sp. 'Peltigera membranacea cyanobiont' 232]OYE05641.1 hypothetical protein CDG79_06780 [Nostoc sp. 'Peltigera membranacea cyanobiont' 232]
MTARTDLTFQELETALAANGLTNALTVISGKLYVDISVVNGVTVADLTVEGVAELLYKLRIAAGKAQTTVNTPLATGEQLASYPPFSYGPPINGQVSVTHVSTFLIPLNENLILSPNV